MKYAFIMGSNSFIVPGNTLVYTDQGQTIDFLRITSIYHDRPAGQGESSLSIDLDIKDVDGSEIKLARNKPVQTARADIAEQRDRLLITRADGTTVIDVHQLDDVSAMRLEHNIIAELEVHSPVAVIRVRGSFMVNDLHLEIDNEKLFVNGNSYANSTLAGKLNLQFTNTSIVL